MELPKRVELFERCVPAAAHRFRCNRQKLVRRFSHRRNDHYRSPVDTGPDDGAYALDGGSRFNGRAAKLHHNH
jgi:hypothetical protein